MQLLIWLGDSLKDFQAGENLDCLLTPNRLGKKYEDKGETETESKPKITFPATVEYSGSTPDFHRSSSSPLGQRWLQNLSYHLSEP